MFTLGKTKYQRFEAKVVIILIIGFILYKIGGYFFEDVSKNIPSTKSDVTTKLIEEYKNKNISVTAVMGTLMILVGGSTMIYLPKDEREKKVTLFAGRALELYGQSRESVIISLVTHRDGVTQSADYIFKVINGKLVLDEKGNK